MTFFGRFLICVIFASSMLMLTWAISVRTQQVPLKDASGASRAEEAKGRLTKLENTIKTLNRAGYRANVAWNDAKTQLVALETERPLRQAFYARQLDLVQTGMLPDPKTGQKKPIAEPVQELQFTPKGTILVDSDQGRPALKESPTGVPLVAIDTYRAQLDRIAGEFKDAQVKEQMAITKHQESTDQLIDIAEKKGLRTLLREQQDLLVRIIDEIAYLQPSLTNGFAESQLLLKRKNSLTNRLNELKDYRGEVRAAGQ